MFCVVSSDMRVALGMLTRYFQGWSMTCFLLHEHLCVQTCMVNVSTRAQRGTPLLVHPAVVAAASLLLLQQLHCCCSSSFTVVAYHFLPHRQQTSFHGSSFGLFLLLSVSRFIVHKKLLLSKSAIEICLPLRCRFQNRRIRGGIMVSTFWSLPASAHSPVLSRAGVLILY